MENEHKIRKFNLLDIVIIILVLIAGIVGYKFLNRGESTSINTQKIIYQVRTQESEPVVYDKITLDTNIYDSVKNYYMGKVINKENIPSTRDVLDEKNEKYVVAEVNDKIDIIITIEADATITDKDIIVGGGYPIKVGNSAYVKGKGYAGIGYVISIERLGE